MNQIGHCKDCRFYALLCRNPSSPYGGKVRLPVHKCFAFEAAKND